jgi:hypothetical protein
VEGRDEGSGRQGLRPACDQVVAEVSEFNQRAYELFLQPAVPATSNGVGAKMMREFHPLRFQRWAFSDLNP